jgi:hypothetical protein
MQLRIKYSLALLLTLAAVSTCPLTAQDATQPQPAKPPRAELALGYTYLNSNAPPGSCDCFSLNGGNATFAWMLKPARFALVGDFAIARAGDVADTGNSLSLTTYTAGVRYLPRMHHAGLQPFGQVLVGVAHASGSSVSSQNAATSNAGAAFAGSVGGGLDLHTGPRFAIRLVEADYLVTTFDNGVNDHQNILRISAGVVLRFGGK